MGLVRHTMAGRLALPKAELEGWFLHSRRRVQWDEPVVGRPVMPDDRLMARLSCDC
jgi:hypothetical protein